MKRSAPACGVETTIRHRQTAQRFSRAHGGGGAR